MSANERTNEGSGNAKWANFFVNAKGGKSSTVGHGGPNIQAKAGSALMAQLYGQIDGLSEKVGKIRAVRDAAGVDGSANAVAMDKLAALKSKLSEISKSSPGINVASSNEVQDINSNKSSPK